MIPAEAIEAAAKALVKRNRTQERLMYRDWLRAIRRTPLIHKGRKP